MTTLKEIKDEVISEEEKETKKKKKEKDDEDEREKEGKKDKKEYKISDLPGIGPSTVQKLEDAGMVVSRKTTAQR